MMKNHGYMLESVTLQDSEMQQRTKKWRLSRMKLLRGNQQDYLNYVLEKRFKLLDSPFTISRKLFLDFAETFGNKSFSIVPQIPQGPKRKTKTIPSPTLIPNCKDLDLDPRSLKVAKNCFIVEHCQRSERCLLFML